MRIRYPITTVLLTALAVSCGPRETAAPQNDMGAADASTDMAMNDAADSGLPPDEGGHEDTSIDMAAVNEPPVAVDDFATASEETAITVEVLLNDTDPNADTLRVTSAQGAENGEIEWTDESITYTPRPGFNGSDVIGYTVADPDGLEDEGVLYVTTYSELAGDAAPQVLVGEAPGLQPEDLAVVINEADAYSVAIGAAYAAARELPDENVIRVSFATGGDVMTPADFATLEADVAAQLTPGVQAFALAWIAPYRVDCMSMTSAFALGYDQQYCGIGAGCQPTAPVDYFDSFADLPWDDHQLRPAMMLALTTEADGLALIDRGIAADETFPLGTGYLVRTSDSARSVRWLDMVNLPMAWAFEMGLQLQYLDNSDGSGTNTIQDASDVMFYFTGLAQVGGLDTLTFLPGAAADHLTSFGGRLTSTSGQMSIVRWLEAGATGSYGTVVEPCNFTQKFPRVSTFLDHYYRGETLIESYWKSVSSPGEGAFVGEPLARPYGRVFLRYVDTALEIGTSWLVPGVAYEVVGADTAEGPFTPVGAPITPAQVGFTRFTVDAPDLNFYMVREVE